MCVCFNTKITQPHQQKGELSIGHDGPQLLINRDEPMSICGKSGNTDMVYGVQQVASVVFFS